MTVKRITRQVVIDWGWEPGTNLEDRVAHRLHRYGHRPGQVAQQHRVGNYRLDFAWPDIQVALECDGWWHRSPEGAARDAVRDADLRAFGWVVFRVDDRDPDDVALQRQIARVSQIIQVMTDSGRCTGWAESRRDQRDHE